MTMKSAARGLGMGLVLLVVACGGTEKPAATPSDETMAEGEMTDGTDEADAATKDLVATAIEAGTFTTLVKAVQTAELVDTLEGEGPFTLFAPTDDAFAALPEATLARLFEPENAGQLAKILSFHVVPGRFMAAELTTTKVDTAAGLKLSIEADGERVTVGDQAATVVKTDIEANNGVIHVIDAVVMPAE